MAPRNKVFRVTQKGRNMLLHVIFKQTKIFFSKYVLSAGSVTAVSYSVTLSAKLWQCEKYKNSSILESDNNVKSDPAGKVVHIDFSAKDQIFNYCLCDMCTTYNKHIRYQHTGSISTSNICIYNRMALQ